jgi:Domain of unknown function (DUF5666)
MHAQHWKALAATCLLSMLAACGGGDDPAPTPTQTAIGTISSFGSVVVNGVRFDDTAASITMDDATRTRDRLRVGMVVQVRGRINANGMGVADSIRYNDCVQGPITAMNREQNSLAVLGQTVLVDDDTVFDGVTLRDLNSFAIGDQVEVSCLPDPANNRLRATRMERQGLFQNGVSELEVKGKVSNLDVAAGTCTIDGLTVDFSGIAAGSLPAGMANGMTLEAGGSSFSNGILTADRLRDRDRDRISYPDGDGLEVEGYVADFASIADFTVAGQAVDATDAVIRNGTAADIRDGLKVEVEGVMSGDVLVATVLVVRRQANVHVESGLQARDSTLGTLTMLGRAIKLTADTVLRDRLTSAEQPTAITLASLNPADRLEVNAYEDAAGDLIATRVERTAADALVVVKGPTQAKVPTTQLTLAGFNVATGANSRYRDAGGTLVDAATFYAAVEVPPAGSTMVRARGVVASLATNVVDATRSVSSIGEVEIVED